MLLFLWVVFVLFFFFKKTLLHSEFFQFLRLTDLEFIATDFLHSSHSSRFSFHLAGDTIFSE